MRGGPETVRKLVKVNSKSLMVDYTVLYNSLGTPTNHYNAWISTHIIVFLFASKFSRRSFAEIASRTFFGAAQTRLR